MVFQKLKGFVAVVGLDDLKALSGQIYIDGFDDLLIVVANENSLHGGFLLLCKNS